MVRSEQDDSRDPGFRAPIHTNRRVVLKAAGMIGALTLAGGLAPLLAQSRSRAQTTSSTRAVDWVESSELGEVQAAAVGEYITVATDFPITGVGAHWDGGVGAWPSVEFRLSLDNVTYTEPFLVAADVDGGQPDRDGRTSRGSSPVAALGTSNIGCSIWTAIPSPFPVSR